jgi:hypothetical protein
MKRKRKFNPFTDLKEYQKASMRVRLLPDLPSVTWLPRTNEPAPASPLLFFKQEADA